MACVCVCVCARAFVCVCVCVCVRERERRNSVGVAGVAGSRNEICVTRGPTSPRLAPLLSSVQLDAVPVSAPARVAARVILFNYVIPVIRARRRDSFSWKERETKGRSPLRGEAVLARTRGRPL